MLKTKNVFLIPPHAHTHTHTHTYTQDFHLNRVMMEEGAGVEPSPAGARPKKKNRKTYDLTAADKFWQKHKGRSVCEKENWFKRPGPGRICYWHFSLLSDS